MSQNYFQLASSIQERMGDLYYTVRVSGHKRNSGSFGIKCIIWLSKSRTFARLILQPSRKAMLLLKSPILIFVTTACHKAFNTVSLLCCGVAYIKSTTCMKNDHQVGRGLTGALFETYSKDEYIQFHL